MTKLIIFFLIPYYSSHAFVLSEQNQSIQNHLLNNNTYVKSEVNSIKNSQQFSFSAAGLHHQSCRTAMKTIGHYENYQNKISFIKSSSYTKNRIHLLLSSSFLPFDMVLDFKLPRINDVGIYPFTFDNGFLLGLKGNIYIRKFTQNKKYKCLIALQANWKGPKTKIPDYIFELFTKTIGHIGLKKLFRMSGHRF